MAGAPDIEAELDELYAGQPDDFVKERNALAKRLGKEGHKDVAAEVRALRKPTRAAALVNELSHDYAKRIEALMKAGEELRDVDTVSDQNKLRAAVASEREAVQALLDAAEKKAAGAGASGPTLERVGETLRAVVTDPELADLVRAGRLDAEREASTIGFELALSPPAAGKGKAKDSKKAKEAKAKQEQAKLDRLIAELESAQRLEREAKERVELARGQLERARAAAKEASKKTKAVERDVATQRRKIA